MVYIGRRHRRKKNVFDYISKKALIGIGCFVIGIVLFSLPFYTNYMTPVVGGSVCFLSGIGGILLGLGAFTLAVRFAKWAGLLY